MIHLIVVSMYERADLQRKNFETLDVPPAVKKHVLIQKSPVGTFAGYIVYSPTNLGCGGGRQYVIDQMMLNHQLHDDDILVFLDDDIYAVKSDWLSKLIHPIGSGRAEIAGVEGRRILPDLNTVPATEKPDYISGGWCAIAGQVFLSGCRFDERYYPNYWEDADFCRQAVLLGFRLQVIGNVGLIHDSEGGNGKQEWESRQKFAAKWGLQLKPPSA